MPLGKSCHLDQIKRDGVFRLFLLLKITKKYFFYIMKVEVNLCIIFVNVEIIAHSMR